MDSLIQPGEDWQHTIESQISKATGVIVLVPDAKSTQVALECGLARAKKKPMLPITNNPTTLANYNLGAYQALLGPEHSAAWEEKLRQSVYTTFNW